jgi:hypothetical protein
MTIPGQRMALTDRLERFFILYLFANPILDILNGIYLYTLNTLELRPPAWLASVTITLVLRIGVLALMCGYIFLRRDRMLFFISLISLAAVLSIYGEIVFSRHYGFFFDAVYAARFLYNIAAMTVFAAMAGEDRYGPERMRLLLRRVFTWSALFMAGSIIVCFVLDSLLPFRVGFFTYGDRFGFRGASGFFNATNEAVSVLMLMLPVVFADFFEAGGFRDKKNWPRLIAPAVVINAMLLVGTKTAFAALALLLPFIVIYQWRKSAACLCKPVNKFIRKRLKQAGALTLALFFFLAFFGMAEMVLRAFWGFEQIIFEEGDDLFWYMEDDLQRLSALNAHPIVRLLLSGRQFHLARTGERWLQNPYTVAFGIGRGSVGRVIEMDFYEILFYYGIFGCAVMLLPYVWKGRRLLHHLKGKKGILAAGIILGLTLTLGYAFIAGHVFFSVMGGFYFSLILVYGMLLLPDKALPAGEAEG